MDEYGKPFTPAHTRGFRLVLHARRKNLMQPALFVPSFLVFGTAPV
ncbi:MAG: hypothetical protein R6W94_06100 [Spirochaetia bacterium]